MAIDWTRGYSCSWRLHRVDTRTWADGYAVGGVTSATVSRGLSGDSPTIDRASFDMVTSDGESLEEGFYRLALTVAQGGVRERVAVCTALCSSGGGTYSYGHGSISVDGGSVLVPASKARLDVGSYAPAGVDGAHWAASLLDRSTPAPVIIGDGASFTIDSHVVFDAGASALEAAWMVLRAGGRSLRIDGEGVVTVVAEPTEPALVIDRQALRGIMPDMDRELDWSDVPNRYIATDGTNTVVAVNDDPSSPTSTITRGWSSDAYDAAPVRVGGETLAAYAARKLEEASVAEDSWDYTREYDPGVLPGDVVRVMVGGLGMTGDLRVRSQRLSCGRGITVEEEAVREVHAWLRG